MDILEWIITARIPIPMNIPKTNMIRPKTNNSTCRSFIGNNHEG